jgi:hypothetical protein
MKEEAIRLVVGAIYWGLVLSFIGWSLGLPKIGQDLKATRKLLESKDSAENLKAIRKLLEGKEGAAIGPPTG